LTNLAVRWQIQDDDVDEAWVEICEKLGNDAKKLSALYSEMPKKFESALALSQLVQE
jgi:hypothetical protein